MAQKINYLSVFTVIILLGFFIILQWKANMVITFMGSEAAAAAAGCSDHNRDDNNNIDDCEALLDSMDQRFDLQRKMSREARPLYLKTTWFNETKIQFDGYEPESVCFTEERFGGETRFGSLGDGPKFVCGVDSIVRQMLDGTTTTAENYKNIGNDDNHCLVYNIGSNNEIGFEQAVSKHLPGCEVHTFDPTLHGPYRGSNYSAFHPWGLGMEGETRVFNNKPSKTKSFTGIMTELGHVGRKINILKIDCEACEYTVMPLVFQAIANGTLDIDQIQVEMHVIGTPAFTKKNVDNFFAAMDNAGFRIFHKERNHIGCNGYTCVEYSLIHKSFLRKANAEVVCGRQYYKNEKNLRR